MTKSIIPEGVRQAYDETEYRVHANPAFTLKVGCQSSQLIEYYQRVGKDCCTYITAFNPWSQQLDSNENRELNTILLNELDCLELPYIKGVGQHPSNAWPGEESFLVFGLSLEASKSLGSKFEQNAIIWCCEDAIPQLILLR